MVAECEFLYGIHHVRKFATVKHGANSFRNTDGGDR